MNLEHRLNVTARLKSDSHNEGKPLRILLLGSTRAHLTGADRDWLNLVNSFDPDEIRILWCGGKGCQSLRPYLDTRVVPEILEVDLSLFTYLLQENAYIKRSRWLWMKILADHLLRLRKPIFNLHRSLRNEPIDIVVSNTAAVTIGAILAKHYRKPHVWCVKECLDTDNPASRKFAAFITRMSSAVVVPSQAVASSFTSEVHILPDGSHIDAIQLSASLSSRREVLERLNLPIDKPVVAQVGGVVWWKGQHVTAEAFARLAVQQKSPNFSLVFLGGDNSDYRKRVEEIIAQAPTEWQEAVRFACFDPNDFSYLAVSDIVVHPSVLPDPYPNAVREAMILGKPVIGSNDGGIPEMIKDGKTGILFEPGDAAELAEAIKSLIDSPERRRAIGDSAQQFALSHFDINRRKHAFIELFQSLLPLPSQPVEKATSPVA